MSILRLNDGIQLRDGTAEALAIVNPIPKAREIMIETDTGKTKIGDGSTAWNSLNYAMGGVASETWTFELENGSTVTREVASWISGA